MKKILLSLFMLFAVVVVCFAEVSGNFDELSPNEIRYTGRLKSYQTAVNDSVNRITVKFYDNQIGGNQLGDSMEFSNVPVSSGIFTLILKPNKVNWAKKDVWLEVSIGVTALSPREKLTSQPYALYAGNGVPAGTVIAYAGKGVPDGYLLCNGDSVDKDRYPALFAAIEYTYGGSGTSFWLPDFRGMFLRGAGEQELTFNYPNVGNVTTKYQATLGQRQGDAIRNITGVSGNIGSKDYSTESGALYQYREGSGGWSGTGSESTRIRFDSSRVVPTASENRPVNYAVNYYIKY